LQTVALIDKHGFCPHLYADDTQIYGSTRHSAVNNLRASSVGVYRWCLQHGCSLTAARSATIRPHHWHSCQFSLVACTWRHQV